MVFPHPVFRISVNFAPCQNRKRERTATRLRNADLEIRIFLSKDQSEIRIPKSQIEEPYTHACGSEFLDV